MPFLSGRAAGAWRRFVFSEYDYSMLPVAAKLGVEPRDARLFMVADGRWKYVHAVGFRPMLFDLETDPQRVPRPRRRPGATRASASGWRPRSPSGGCGCRSAPRSPTPQIEAGAGKSQRQGILIGVWDESEIPDELWSRYLGDGAEPPSCIRSPDCDAPRWQRIASREHVNRPGCHRRSALETHAAADRA